MPLTLYLLRHGQTSCSRANVFCGAGQDPELTEDGQQMAHAFAAAYRTIAWAAIYTSPQQRALATAQPLCAAVSIVPMIRDELKEIAYGQWEGMSADAVDTAFHDDYLKWSAEPGWNPPTGGEAAIMIARRGQRVIEEITQRCNSGNVLIVSHKATIRILLCTLVGIDVSHFRTRLGCPVGSVSIVEFGAQGPLLKVLADRTHLSARLRELPGT